MKPGISGLTFGADHPLDGDILLAAVNGFTHLDIVASKLERYLAQPEFDVRDLTRLFLRTQPGALDGLNAVEFGPAEREALLAEAEPLFRQARRLGAATVIVRPAPTAAGQDEIAATLTVLAALAQRWSVRLALAPVAVEEAPDPVPQPEGGFLSPLASYSGLSSLLARVAHPSLRLLVDTVLVAREGAVNRLSTLSRESIAHVHLADAAADGGGPRLLPGHGRLPLAAMLAAMAATGYDGIVAVALAPESTPQTPPDLARAAREALDALFAAAGVQPR